MELKYRVYCEFEIDGKIQTSMESPASWFLLTQTGKLWSYGPGQSPRPVGKEYKKAIPLFWTGLKDIEGTEIYQGDILHIWAEYDKGKRIYDGGNWEVYWRNDRWHLKRGEEQYDNGDYYQGDECPWPDIDDWKPSENGSRIKVIGNIFENPELLKEK